MVKLRENLYLSSGPNLMRLQVSRNTLCFSGCPVGQTLYDLYLFSGSFLDLAHDHLHGQFPDDLLEAHLDPLYGHCLLLHDPLLL